MEWITIDVALPEPQKLTHECNDYYFVKIKRFQPVKAMYIEEDGGTFGWYTNYFSKIILPVIAWCNIEYND